MQIKGLAHRASSCEARFERLLARKYALVTLGKRKRKPKAIELSPVPLRYNRRRESKRDARQRVEASNLLSEAQSEVRMAVDIAMAVDADTAMADDEAPGEARLELHFTETGCLF